jgi:hypothetical protein
VSVESIALALHHSRATGTAKLVLIGIANHDGDGGAYPSMRTLAKYAGCTIRNARKGVERLVSLGEIRVFVQQGGERDWADELRPNRYEFLLMCPPQCDRTKHHRMPREAPLTLWKNPRSEETGGSVATGGSPVGSDRLTVHNQPSPSGGASTTDRASLEPAPTPPCTECSAPDLTTCIARQAKLDKTDRHTYSPRPPRHRADG